MVAALGVLHDLTVSQSSTVLARRHANPHLSSLELFRRGMSVGHDHIVATVNTLVLAYAGASLPVLWVSACQAPHSRTPSTARWSRRRSSRRWKALGDPTRLTIAAVLRDSGELCVCDLSWVTERSDRLVSHHARALRATAVTTARPIGLRTGPPTPGLEERHRLAARVRLLSCVSLVYMAARRHIAILAGVMAGSIALIGSGIDSAIDRRRERGLRLAAHGATGS